MSKIQSWSKEDDLLWRNDRSGESLQVESFYRGRSSRSNRRWEVLLPSGESHVYTTKEDAVDFARSWMREHPFAGHELGEFDDYMYAIVVPAYDNEGSKIKEEEIERVSDKIANRFGGVTIDKVKGGWKTNQGIQYETLYRMTGVRDSPSEVSSEEDEQWMEDLASRVGERFGQASVLVSAEKTDARFIDGKWKERLDEEILQPDMIEKPSGVSSSG